MVEGPLSVNVGSLFMVMSYVPSLKQPPSVTSYIMVVIPCPWGVTTPF